jgi:GrpB-like predicted nucleotidyltransferase (UPF0157 family)
MAGFANPAPKGSKLMKHATTVGYKSGDEIAMALVEEYHPEWAEWFSHIKDVLAGKLGVHCLAIEHFGSTSVAGMAAKPIIDIDVVIEANEFEKVKELLQELGYCHNGDQGIPGREAFKLEDAELAAMLPAHHLYVCAKEAAELQRHRAFRNFLCAHPDWVERLSALKQTLCDQYGDDREAYMAGKDAMVKEITRLALLEVREQER